MRSIFFFTTCALVIACGSNNNSDAGADGSPTDGTTGGDSSGNNDGSMNGDSGTGADGGPLVNECQALAKNFEMKCSGSNPRPCLWQGYGKLCAIGRTQLLIDSMKCLDASTCRTFSDPNQGAACLGTLHTAQESPAAKALIQNGCMTCGGSNCSMVTGQQEIIPYLTDSDITMVQACAGSACTIDQAIKNCPNVPGMALFLPCTN